MAQSLIRHYMRRITSIDCIVFQQEIGYGAEGQDVATFSDEFQLKFLPEWNCLEKKLGGFCIFSVLSHLSLSFVLFPF
jgi:hypothetical protein